MRALMQDHTGLLQARVVGAPPLAPAASDVQDYRFHAFLCLADDFMDCRREALRILAVTSILCVLITVVVCAFCSVREDKEEQITPLCPQLVVRRSDLSFRMVLGKAGRCFEVVESEDPEKVVCKVTMDWTDPKCSGGLVATAQLRSANGSLLATVVARHVSKAGQALALCRAGSEIFAFVEPESHNRYLVRHRTNVPLLAMVGDFDTWDVDGVNPAGAKVCSLKRQGGVDGEGSVQQHVDAGLVICSFLASYMHRLLCQPATADVPPAFGFKHELADEDASKKGAAAAKTPPQTVVAGAGCEDTAAEPEPEAPVETLGPADASEALPAGDPFSSSTALAARDASEALPTGDPFASSP